MDPLEFERLMARYFEGEGYRVEHSGTGGRATRYDGGIDLKLYRPGEYVVVQCKRSTVLQVTHNPVHELLGVMHTEGATGAIFITSGEFTDAALNKMRGIPRFRMVDGHELRKMLGALLETIRPDTAEVDKWADIELSAPLLPRQAVPPRELPPLPFRKAFRPSKDMGPLLFGAAVLLVAVVSCVRNLADTTPADTASRRHSAPAAPVPLNREPRPVPGTAYHARWPEPVVLPPPRRQTPEQAREAQRQADEAMRVIEATTPEM